MTNQFDPTRPKNLPNLPVVMHDLNDVVTCHEFSLVLGIAPSTVRLWITRYGDFPAPIVRRGHTNFFSLQELLKWYDNHNWDPRRKEPRMEPEVREARRVARELQKELGF